MKRAIKLVLYYFGYQLLITLPFTFIFNMLSDKGSLSAEAGAVYATGIGMVLSGIVMIWHLIHFKYVKFNLKSFSEVPVKTIWLSIPLIIGAMTFFNFCSEFVELPNWMEDEFIGMSRNVFGVLSVAIMAPLVEELLFRGAIEDHLLRQGKSPVVAILISALIFGIIHINPAQVRLVVLPHRQCRARHHRPLHQQLHRYHPNDGAQQGRTEHQDGRPHR